MNRCMGQNATLYRLFEQVSRNVWENLRDSYNLGLYMGEEGITDHLLLTLARNAVGQIKLAKVSKPLEGTTGADWEWWFVRDALGFGMRVQAKKLRPDSLRYVGLKDTIGHSGVRRQVDLLIDKAESAMPSLYPAYCFYNFWSDNHKLPQWNCASFRLVFPELFGCSIADAHRVRACLDEGRDDLATIGPLACPLICLVCDCICSSKESLPQRVCRAAEALRNDTYDRPSSEGTIQYYTIYTSNKFVINDNAIPPRVTDVPDYVMGCLEEGLETRQAIRSYLERQHLDGLLIVREK
ncbi:MAG: DUF6615 family protein [Candidatus Methylacidiphilaceae bacterium]